MNKEIFERHWTRLRHELRGWWARLTDDDVEQFNGQFDELVALLKERCGYTREQAEEEIDMHLQEYQAWLKKKGLPPL